MGFVAPLFLIGLLGVGLPIWLHRLQAQSAERQPFSSAMLLESAQQRVHVRRKLKHLVLLAARIALLVVLAIAFAKPFVNNPPAVIAATESGTHLIAVDVSASMGRDGVFAGALATARRALADAPAGALKQLLAAGGDITPVTAPAVEQEVHASALTLLAPDSQRMVFSELMAAADRYAEALPKPVSLHLISDFQRSAMPSRFADLGTRHLSRLIPHRVEAGASPNRGIEFIRSNLPSGGGEGSERFVEVGLVGAAGDTVELQLNGETVARETAAAGTLKFAQVPAVDGDNRVEARLLSTDGYAADDIRFHVFEQVPPQRIPVLTGDQGGLGFTYLANALASGGSFAALPMRVSEFDPRVLSRYRMLLVEDLGVMDATLEAALTEWIVAGGQVLGFAGPRTASLERLPVGGQSIVPATTRARQRGFASPARVDGSHPLLAQTEGWFNARFREVLPLAVGDNDEILVTLDNGAPLVIETSLGRGKLLAVTATLHDRSNDFPIRAVFVGFIVEAARYLTGTSNLPRAFAAGEWFSLAAAPGGAGQVLDPDGNPLLSLGGAARVRQVRLRQPGIYSVYTPNKEYAIAVNTDVRESQFATVDEQVLADWVKLTTADATSPTGAGGGSAAPAAPAGKRLELWPWALLLLVVLVICESLLGNAHFAPQAARE